MAQDAEKKAFLTDAMRTQMHLAVRAAFRAGWLQLAFMEVGGEKAAGYLNFDYGDHIWVYNSGIDFALPRALAGLGAAGLPAAVGQRAQAPRLSISCAAMRSINTASARSTAVWCGQSSAAES